ncbi:MAG: serine hydrolase [Ignavibacteriae bacterium]|nr:serine hydrolase [Ignavibacteriota bacterium]
MKNRICKLILIAVFVFSINVFAQDNLNLNGYEQYVENAMKDWKVQGCAVAIVKNGKIVYTKGFGFRDVKNNLPVTPSTLFAIGSCSKAFTSASVCLMVDEGKIDFDKPVITYYPNFKLQDDYITTHITIRDLLCHRSGLPRHDFAWYGADNLTRKDIVEALRYLEPSKGFREVWQYQNGMFTTAGYLVEVVSGEKWENIVAKQIFEQLGMKSSNFSVNESQKSTDFAKPYTERKDVVKEIPFRSLDAMGPAGSINSNVTDMANWIIMQINGGKFNDKQIISDASLRQTQTPQMIVPSLINDEVFYNMYGMGWMITSYRGHLRLEHGGNIDGFSASVCFLPRDSIGIVVLTNMDGTMLTSVARNYAIDKLLGLSEIDWSNRLIGDIKKAKETMKEQEGKKDPNRVEGTEPSHPLKAYTGKYEHPAYGYIEIILNDGKLITDFHSMKADLSHYHYDIFETIDNDVIPKIKISFYTNLKGDIDKISIPLQDGVKDIEFKKVVEKKDIDKSSLNKYIGDYEISGTVTKISLRGGNTLILSITGQPDYELIPIGENGFNIKDLEGFSVKFTEVSGKITEIVFNQPNGVFTAKRK